MDKRLLPFALPGIGSEQEEAIALLSFVGDELLAEYHRAVNSVRRRAERLSNGLLAVAFVCFCLFLLQDFETAPIATLLLPAAATGLLLALALLARTWLIAPARFAPPRLLQARKLLWQWLAIPLDDERVVLWDTLTDEALALDLPPNPPRRPDWLWREPDPLHSIEEEKALLKQLGDVLQSWQLPPATVRLPRIQEGHEELVSFLKHLPRGSRWEPPPALPPARSLEEGQEDLRRLMQLHQMYAILLRQYDGWQERVPLFADALRQALRGTLPHMEAPPAPPPAHPSGDVESLVATLELVRATAIEALRQPLKEELARLQSELDKRLKVLEEDSQRERNIVHYGSDTLISALQRRITEMEQRTLPEAEKALKEAETKRREAVERVKSQETELVEAQNQLKVASGGSKGGPRASDERKQKLDATIARLSSALPQMRLNVQTWDDVVASHRSALDRERFQLERTQKEHREYVEDRDQRLAQIDQDYQRRQAAVQAEYAPLMSAIEADLTFFDELPQHFGAALDPYRVDLIMDDEAVRPYIEVVQQAQQILLQKQAAISRWAERVIELIRQRRETTHRIIAAMDAAALPNFGLQRMRLMQLPLWYIEVERTRPSLWPWQRGTATTTSRLIAPFVEAADGRRLALTSTHIHRLKPHGVLQQRLTALMAGERWKAVQEAARELGLSASFESRMLNVVALDCQMPRAMQEMLEPLAQPALGGVAAPLAPAAEEHEAALREGDAAVGDEADESDEFVLQPSATAEADAWSEERSADDEVSDAWDETPNSVPPESAPPRPPQFPAGDGHRGENGRAEDSAATPSLLSKLDNRKR